MIVRALTCSVLVDDGEKRKFRDKVKSCLTEYRVQTLGEIIPGVVIGVILF